MSAINRVLSRTHEVTTIFCLGLSVKCEAGLQPSLFWLIYSIYIKGVKVRDFAHMGRGFINPMPTPENTTCQPKTDVYMFPAYLAYLQLTASNCGASYGGIWRGYSCAANRESNTVISCWVLRASWCGVPRGMSGVCFRPRWGLEWFWRREPGDKSLGYFQFEVGERK